MKNFGVLKIKYLILNKINFSVLVLAIVTILFPLFDSSIYFGFLLIFSTLFFIFNYQQSFSISKSFFTFIILLFVFWIVSLISYTFFTVSNLSYHLSDILEILKIPYYFLVGTFLYIAFRKKPEIVETVFSVVFFFIVFIGVSSYFIDNIALLYTSSKIVYTKRLAAPFINPYTFAFCIVFYLYYYYFKFLIGIYSSNVRFMSFILFCLSFLLLFFTQSRSILLAAAVGILFSSLMVWIFLSRSRRRSLKLNLKRLIFFQFLIFICCYWSIYALDLRYTISLIEQALTERVYESGSVEVRVQQIWTVFQYYLAYPFSFFGGFGPAKTEMKLLESGYAYILFRHGLIGVILYSLLFLAVFLMSLRQINDKRSAFYLAIALYIISFPILLSSSMHIEHPKASFFFLMIVGATFSRLKISQREVR